MIILVSDLHLADTATRSTINVPHFVQRLTNIVNAARESGAKEIQIVLLGDIFEILKSKRWLEAGVRPWESCTERHIETVTSIFDGIVSTNLPFFQGLQVLASEQNVKLTYIPGNHDLPINTLMGAKARPRLKELLSIKSTSDKFGNYLLDEEHGLIARHGHEWDSSNRYSSGLSAVGDAIVIDLLLQLPMVVAGKLGRSEEDPSLIFLHELDNIRPQIPRVMARWILRGLDLMGENNKSGHKKIQDAFYELANQLLSLRDVTTFETFEDAAWWIRFLSELAPLVVKHFGSLDAVKYLPGGGEGPGTYREYALSDFQQASAAGGEYKYVVCGHTHLPLIEPIDLVGTSERKVRLYLNTGTWRRVYRLAPTTSGVTDISAFAVWDEECLVNIYNLEEQSKGLPCYEFSRMTRGAKL